jgi:hypothetical protein
MQVMGLEMVLEALLARVVAALVHDTHCVLWTGGLQWHASQTCSGRWA